MIEKREGRVRVKDSIDHSSSHSVATAMPRPPRGLEGGSRVLWRIIELAAIKNIKTIKNIYNFSIATTTTQQINGAGGVRWTIFWSFLWIEAYYSFLIARITIMSCDQVRPLLRILRSQFVLSSTQFKPIWVNWLLCLPGIEALDTDFWNKVQL